MDTVNFLEVASGYRLSRERQSSLSVERSVDAKLSSPPVDNIATDNVTIVTNKYSSSDFGIMAYLC